MGGPAYRLMQRVGIIEGAGPSVGRRSVCFIVATWIPLLLLAALEGNAIGPTPRSSLLLDFATYARLFIAVPLIFAAEGVVGPRLHGAGLRFLHGGLVHRESAPDFTRAVARVRRRREAALPEIAFALVALFGAWFLTLEQLSGLGTASRELTWGNRGPQMLPAGLWYHLVVAPLIQFFVFRWVWRWAIWTLFLWDMSRLRLNVLPTHADMAAGLGFLGVAHVSLSIFPFAVGCVIAAEIAFQLQFEGLTLSSLQSMIPLLAAYLLFVEFVTFGPLLIFVPLLARTRREGLRRYGTLVQRHNQLFHDKCIEGEGGAQDSPLGNPDMSSLVDLGSSFAVIREMNVVPVNRRQLLQVAAVACMPGLPLLFLVLPLAEVIKLFAGIVV
jgi:hypothetical protein